MRLDKSCFDGRNRRTLGFLDSQTILLILDLRG